MVDKFGSKKNNVTIEIEGHWGDKGGKIKIDTDSKKKDDKKPNQSSKKK